ncbi:asparagine synthase (glutamine-hydrolyzing) [Desulfosporosinus fructosivorans]
MCGISGIINKRNETVTIDEIEKLTEIIKHRGPDDGGYFFGESLALGHKRLSIIDPSDSGHQPMLWYNKYVIIYNGEVYNYQELKNELISNGYLFRTETDTEVILASYDHWGKNCVDHFNGMWSFAIYDRENFTIFCSRDRLGVKPFYYYTSQDKFVFASEIKQFTTLPGWKAKANRQRLSDFLLFEVFDHTDETLFENVYQLKGGHNLVYDLRANTYSVYKYFTLGQHGGEHKYTFARTKEHLQKLFYDSIRLRLRADVKLGSCLSGGLDSSSIVCVANRLLLESNVDFEQETVSSCFMDKRYDEQEYIDSVIENKSLIGHKVFPELEHLFDSLDELTWFQDEPFGSTSIFAQWNVFKAAKEHNIRVMLDGQGADEQLAGYDGFYGVFLFELFKKLQWKKLFIEMRALKRLYGYPVHKILFSTFKWLFPGSIMAFLKLHIFKRGPFCWIKSRESYYKESLKNNYAFRAKSVREYALNQMLVTSLPKLLHYEDRDSMAHSVESRVPFLDYRLVELILDMPSTFKIHEGTTKYIMREAMEDDLPEKVKNRKDKMGFVTPEEEWIRVNKDFFKKEISEACDLLHEMVDKDKVLAWYEKIVNSPGKIDFTIWRLISINRWAKVFKVEV